MEYTQEENSGSGKTVEFIFRSRTLTDDEFKTISDMIYNLCRINLHNGKKELVQARLNKRLRQLGMTTYNEYLEFIDGDDTGQELINMVDILSTNLTYFFREPDHFDYFRDEVLAKINPDKTPKFRVWSAGCSSGEEAYTMAMVMREALPDIDRMDALILATDISTRMLAVAQEGVYNEQRFRDTPPLLRGKYFEPVGRFDGYKKYKAIQSLSKLIRFRYLNLMKPWPMAGQLDVVFCRNVMIYFDKITQGELVNRFYDAIKPGGVFIVGHSESLTGISHKFKYVRPTIYLKQ